MGRRKKEPQDVHRQYITDVAAGLFESKGVIATTMDDVAKASGYSKATLYVYFKNKDELVTMLVVEAMKMLHSKLSKAITTIGSIHQRYHYICQELILFQEESPFYFEMALGEIKVDINDSCLLSIEQEMFNIGEQINELIGKFILQGIQEGEFRKDLDIIKTVFLFYASLSGLIKLGVQKKIYIEKRMTTTYQDFLYYGFDILYRSLQSNSDKGDEK